MVMKQGKNTQKDSSHLKESQVSQGVDGVQRTAVIVSGRVHLRTLEDSNVQRQSCLHSLRRWVNVCRPPYSLDGVAQPLDLTQGRHSVAWFGQ